MKITLTVPVEYESEYTGSRYIEEVEVIATVDADEIAFIQPRYACLTRSEQTQLWEAVNAEADRIEREQRAREESSRLVADFLGASRMAAEMEAEARREAACDDRGAIADLALAATEVAP